MGSRRVIRLFAAILVACAAVIHLAPAGDVGAARAAEFPPDCTSPAVNDYFRNTIHKARTQSGERVADRATLSVVGTMKPVARNGAKLTCWARVRVSIDGRSAIRSTTVYLTIRGGEIVNLDFIMAANR
jgi:hypothetical protein